jgi:hypothetical protein
MVTKGRPHRPITIVTRRKIRFVQIIVPCSRRGSLPIPWKCKLRVCTRAQINATHAISLLQERCIRVVHSRSQATCHSLGSLLNANTPRITTTLDVAVPIVARSQLFCFEFHNSDRLSEMQIVLQRGNFSHTIYVDVEHNSFRFDHSMLSNTDRFVNHKRNGFMMSCE